VRATLSNSTTFHPVKRTYSVYALRTLLAGSTLVSDYAWLETSGLLPVVFVPDHEMLTILPRATSKGSGPCCPAPYRTRHLRTILCLTCSFDCDLALLRQTLAADWDLLFCVWCLDPLITGRPRGPLGQVLPCSFSFPRG
jgi:hypothetical protein